GIETLDPKITKSAFARFAIAIGPILAFHGRVLGVAEKFRTASAIAFGFSNNAFASRAAGRGVGGSWHFVLFPQSRELFQWKDASDVYRDGKIDGRSEMTTAFLSKDLPHAGERWRAERLPYSVCRSQACRLRRVGVCR